MRFLHRQHKHAERVARKLDLFICIPGFLAGAFIAPAIGAVASHVNIPDKALFVLGLVFGFGG